MEELRAQVERGAATMELATIRKKLAAHSHPYSRFARERLEALDEEPVAASGVLRDLRTAISKGALHREALEKGYSRAELAIVFLQPTVQSRMVPQASRLRPGALLAPVLMTYTGARREEVAQLLVSDLEQDAESGVWCLAIRPGDGKSLKTASNRRKVPLHDDLLASAFSTTGQASPPMVACSRS